MTSMTTLNRTEMEDFMEKEMLLTKFEAYLRGEEKSESAISKIPSRMMWSCLILWGRNVSAKSC